MHQVLFKFGYLTIYTYGVFVFSGVLAAYLVCRRYSRAQGIEEKTFSNIFFWFVIAGFLGAKTLYILLEFRYFLKEPFAMLRSGFVFYGAFIAASGALYFLAKKYNVRFIKLADVLSLGAPLGHALGRIGCFFYGCCYGEPGDYFFCVLFPANSPAGILGLKLIPTQLISAFFLFLIFFLLLFRSQRKKYDGQIFIYYSIIYGIFRFIIEFYRADPRGQFFSLSTSQVIAIILIITGVFSFCRLRRTT